MTARQRPVSPITCPGITCRDRILRWLTRRIENPADAEDIAGEICLHCLKGMRRFRGEAEFATWRHRITLNVFSDYLRAKGRRAARETRGITDTYSTAPAD